MKSFPICLLLTCFAVAAQAQVSTYTTFPEYRTSYDTTPVDTAPAASVNYYTMPEDSYYTPYYQSPYSTNQTIIYPTTTSTTYWHNDRPYNYNRYYYQAGSGCTLNAGALVCY